MYVRMYVCTYVGLSNWIMVSMKFIVQSIKTTWLTIVQPSSMHPLSGGSPRSQGEIPSLCVGKSGHAYIRKVQWSVELVDMNLWNTINLKSENLIINLQINKISVFSLYPYPEIFYIKFITVQLFIRWVVPCASPSDGEYGKWSLR